jgi:hypothetical protein
MKLSYLAVLAAFLLPLTPAAAAPQKLMVFNFYFDNTSLEPTTPAETARLKMISNKLRADLEASKLYDVVPGKVADSISVPQVGKCSDDQLAAARKAGVALAGCPWIQKVSNLILNLNIVIQNAKTGQYVKGGSVDIRGNTDDSWEHGLNFLLQEHVFPRK